MVSYRLARPVADNKAAFLSRFPKARYLGDVGDVSHLAGSGDHTPWPSDVIFGMRMPQGLIWAGDYGGGPDLPVPEFARFILDSVRAGAYPEIKYVISRHEANKGRDGGRYYGLHDRRYSWRTQRSMGHTDYVHISYMPSAANSPSTLIADFYDHLHGLRKAAALTPEPPAALKRWHEAPALPATPLGRYSRLTLDRLPFVAYPPLVPGLGGPEGPQAQRDWCDAMLSYAVRQCHTTMVTQAEIDRSELGHGFIGWAKMVTQVMAGNPWVNDPSANARAFGAAIGAPASWGQGG